MVTFATNTAKNSAVTAKDEDFLKVPQGTSVRGRVLPAFNADGLITFMQQLHFKMKDPDGDGTKGIAPGCTKFHGNSKSCLFCDVADLFAASTDPAESELVTDWTKSIKVSTATYVPFLQATKGTDGKFAHTGDPILLKLAPSGADALSETNADMEDNDLPLINDVEKGQDIIVSNPKTAGKYTVKTTSLQVHLDKIKPGWEEMCAKFEDVEGNILKTKVLTRDKQEAILRHTFPHLDWDAAMKELEG